PDRYPVAHRNVYYAHQRVAAAFRKGRVFLAGDAAHVNNPLGGLGLNFGIHDALALAAMLGRVIRGEAAADTLDDYDRLRRPLNVEYVQQQTIANKKRLEEKDPAVRARNHAAPPAPHGGPARPAPAPPPPPPPPAAPLRDRGRAAPPQPATPPPPPAMTSKPMTVYALIPARSGSKGLPDKNILEIDGHPLIA